VGSKWVIVNFFATWCEPCKEELPELEKMQEEIGTEKLQIIVFATDKEKSDVKEYFSKRPTNLTVLLDPYQMAYQRYNDAKDGIPTIFLIDKQGKLAMSHVGYDPEFIAKMRATIEETE
jgi:thiol-disulfide isomerase/thioredoxin